MGAGEGEVEATVRGRPTSQVPRPLQLTSHYARGFYCPKGNRTCADNIVMDARATVLVIEDSPVVQHLLRATLTPMGFDLHFALDGESGLTMARHHVPDVITLDIGLPGIDGWEVLTELRGDGATSHIQVIVLTAHAQSAMEKAAADCGADGFLTKPFRPADLRDAVASLIARNPIGLAAGL